MTHGIANEGLRALEHQPAARKVRVAWRVADVTDAAVFKTKAAELEAELRRRDAELRESRAKIESRDRMLAQALEQQTAVADILRAIVNLPTDAQPVLDAVAQSAGRLLSSTHGLSGVVP